MRRRALRGYAAPEWADRTHAGTRGALPAPPPSASGLFASFAEREHALHIGAMCTPAAFVRLLIDDEVVLQRRSLSPCRAPDGSERAHRNGIRILARNSHDSRAVRAFPGQIGRASCRERG